MVRMVGKKEQLLKKFKESEKFFNHVGLRMSNIYFKISLYKFLTKFLVLKISSNLPNYFKSNLKAI